MSLASAIHEGDPILGLVPDADTQHIGYVFKMGYDSALILTNDAWRDRVGGVPLNCILAASEIEFDEPGQHDPSEASAVILRVIGSARLPMDDDALRTVIEMHTRRTHRRRADEHDGYDGMTHAELQWGGLECRILGTMYNRDGDVHLGADVEDFPSAVQSRVYKLGGNGLSSVVNFVDPIRAVKARQEAEDLGFERLPEPVEIGEVRYTSADRRHRQSGANVTVEIQPFDLLARRTAVFGMTRTGKSNTTKTMVSEIALAAARGRQNVGQLIFDMNGEYANANHQDDGSSLAEVFGGEENDAIVRYRIGEQQEGFRDLRTNFYDNIQRSLEMLQKLAGADLAAGQSQEFRTFLQLEIPEPEQGDFSAMNRYQIKVALYHALLAKARFEAAAGFRVQFVVRREIVNAVGQALLPDGDEDDWLDLAGGTPTRTGVRCSLTAEDAVGWFEAARAMQDDFGRPGRPWLDSDGVILADMLAGKSKERNDAQIATYRTIERQRAYHSPRGTSDVARDVYDELTAGKIVILDLSVGIESVRKAISEDVAKYVFGRSMGAFHGGQTPPNLVLYVEEAHNLIGGDAKPDDTWPRIAKEGAKARIALVYATQEPSSIQKNILANTENIFCTHLNNDDEIRVLSKYYDFSDFSASIKRAQDVGFARMKTLSAPFVVPTQIRKFEPIAIAEKWAEANEAAS